jgi:hypothetical protein
VELLTRQCVKLSDRETRVSSSSGGGERKCRLNLSMKQLLTVPTNVIFLSGIVELDVSSNLMTVFPSELSKLRSLRRLNLAWNKINHLPAAINTFKALRTLNMSFNGLASVSDALCDLRLLEDLQLHDNKISMLPAAMGQLSSLSVLNLKYNQLQALPASLGALELRELDIMGNPLEGSLGDVAYAGVDAILAHLKTQTPVKSAVRSVYDEKTRVSQARANVDARNTANSSSSSFSSSRPYKCSTCDRLITESRCIFCVAEFDTAALVEARLHNKTSRAERDRAAMRQAVATASTGPGITVQRKKKGFPKLGRTTNNPRSSSSSTAGPRVATRTRLGKPGSLGIKGRTMGVRSNSPASTLAQRRALEEAEARVESVRRTASATTTTTSSSSGQSWNARGGDSNWRFGGESDEEEDDLGLHSEDIDGVTRLLQNRGSWDSLRGLNRVLDTKDSGREGSEGPEGADIVQLAIAEMPAESQEYARNMVRTAQRQQEVMEASRSREREAADALDAQRARIQRIIKERKEGSAQHTSFKNPLLQRSTAAPAQSVADEGLDASTDDETPGAFLCPITYDIMSNPVVCSDGHTYERLAIEKWLEKKQTSPMTSEELTSKTLTPNFAMKSMIEMYKQKKKRKPT